VIPSTVKNRDLPTSAPQQDVKMAPLTVGDVLKMTRLEHGDPLNHRRMRHFSWVENECSSLKGRIDYINKTTSRIIESIPLRESPVTLVSLGSGGLLTEYFIHQQLKKAGYRQLYWRVIDLDYQNSGYEQCRKDFKIEAGNENVKAFTTEQAYFRKSIDHNFLSDNDKNQGAVVVLNVSPPRAITDSSSTAGYDSDCMLIRGRPIEEAEKANGIYLLMASPASKEDLLNVKKALSEGDSIVYLDCALNCSVNSSGKVVVIHSPSPTGRALNEGIKPYVDKLEGVANSVGRKIDLLNLNKSLEGFVDEMNSRGAFALKFLVSDYDTSLDKLREYFLDGNNPVIFATFDNNECSFT
jgi:hypothetical protein